MNEGPCGMMVTSEVTLFEQSRRHLDYETRILPRALDEGVNTRLS